MIAGEHPTRPVVGIDLDAGKIDIARTEAWRPR